MSGTSDRRPRIGITAWRRGLPTALGERTDLYTLGTEYVECVREAGGLPVILPDATDAATVPDVFDIIDGLLLSGGGDIHPSCYGAADEGVSHDVNADADHWEIALVRAAAARRVPVLGICRGMQIMAVAFGGRLRQDIADLPGHPDMGRMTPNDILDTRHHVEIAPTSRCAAMYAATSHEVNTIHHQAVVDSGTLAVAARGDGGFIEAVEAHADWPALGVQWHPEKAQRPDEINAERELFRRFVAQAAAYARERVR